MASELVVAFITDLHFGPEARFRGKLRKLTAQGPQLARAFVEHLNRVVRPDIVVNLGDDIEDESHDADLVRYAECISILRQVDAELVHVAGNHDTINLEPAEALAIQGRPVPPGQTAEVFSSFDRGPFHFVVLRTLERQDREITVDEPQLRWLAADLSSHHKPTIVLMHHSVSEQDLRGNPWFEGRAHVGLVRERARIRQLFEQSRQVRAVFNGHMHWNHLDVICGIPYITVQSLIENLDDDAPGRAAGAHAVARMTEERIVVEIGGAERARYQIDY